MHIFNLKFDNFKYALLMQGNSKTKSVYAVKFAMIEMNTIK